MRNLSRTDVQTCQSTNAQENATYRSRIVREEASFFQPDISLSNKVPIAVDEKHDFYNRPRRIPDVRDLISGASVFRIMGQSNELTSSSRVRI